MTAQGGLEEDITFPKSRSIGWPPCLDLYSEGRAVSSSPHLHHRRPARVLDRPTLAAKSFRQDDMEKAVKSFPRQATGLPSLGAGSSRGIIIGSAGMRNLER